MKTTKYLKAFFIVMIVLNMAPSAMGEQTIELGYIEFPPVFSTNASGKPEGTLIDLADKVLTHAGYKWRGSSLPTKRMAKELVDGNIHLWIGLSTLPEFEGKTLIGKSKVAEITLQAYMIGKKPPILKQEDLKDKSVIIMRGYSYGGWITFILEPTNQVKYLYVDDHKGGFKMLQAQRADYFLDYREPAEKALTEMSISDLNHSQISSFGAYFVVSKKAPNAEQLLKQIEKSYDELIKAGKIKKED